MANQILSNKKITPSGTPHFDYLQIHQHRYQEIISRIQKLNLPPHAKILDIGCYPPHLSERLRELGYQVSGICSPHEKIDEPWVASLDIQTEKFPYQSNNFDLILLTEVIEHLPFDVTHLFSQIKRVLNPGGFLMITTPNVCRLQNIALLILGKNIYFSLEQLSTSQPSSAGIYHRHNREYTLSELTGLISKLGFKPCLYRHFISYTPFRKKNFTDPFYLKLIKLTNYLLSLLLKPYRDSLMLIASKR